MRLITFFSFNDLTLKATIYNKIIIILVNCIKLTVKYVFLKDLF